MYTHFVSGSCTDALSVAGDMRNTDQGASNLRIMRRGNEHNAGSIKVIRCSDTCPCLFSPFELGCLTLLAALSPSSSVALIVFYLIPGRNDIRMLVTEQGLL